MKTKIKNYLLIPSICAFFPGITIADVTISQFVEVDAGGGMSMLASEGTITTTVSGDRARTDNRIESQSKMMRKFAKNMNASTIVMLDEELMLSLDTEKRQYSELSLAQMKQQLEAGMEASQGGAGALPVSEDECQWSEPVVDVVHSKEKQRFGGVKAEQHLITASQTCTVPNGDRTCKLTWNMESWSARKMPGQKELQAFQENLAKKLGGDDMLAMAKVNTGGLLAMFKRGWGDVLNEFDEIKGYPVKTVMSLEMGGENCTTQAGQPIALDEVWGDAIDAGVSAAGQTAATHAGHAVAEETSEALGQSVGGQIAGSAVGAASRELVSGMFSKFGKKKKKKQEQERAAEQARQANPASGSVMMFRITSELTSVNDNDIARSLLSRPGNDWKKVKASGF